MKKTTLQLHITVKYYDDGNQTDHGIQAQSQPKLSNIKYQSSSTNFSVVQLTKVDKSDSRLQRYND